MAKTAHVIPQNSSAPPQCALADMLQLQNSFGK
jgi:hypothetical protein